MKINVATQVVIPNLMRKLGVEHYQTEAFTLVLDKGGQETAIYKRDAGNEYFFVVDELPRGIRIKSSNGYYDANSPFGIEKEELHTGQFKIENFLATQQTVQLVRIQPYK